MPTLSIHITDLCNSACSFCVVASPLYMKDTVDYQSVVDFLQANAHQGFDAVNLHGGEPTIHPRFLDILRMIRRFGYPQTHVQTNGIRLSDPTYVTTLMELGVRSFIVSLHGDRPDVQDSQTATPGGFNKTVQGIRNVKAQQGYVRTNTVITRRNLNRLTSIVELACDLGADHINLSNLHPVGSALLSRENAMMTFSEMHDYVVSAVNVARSYGRGVTLEGFPCCVITECLDHMLTNTARGIRMLARGTVLNDYDDFMARDMSVYSEGCRSCTLRQRCGGVYPQYIEYKGWSEFVPLTEAAAAAI
jgi:MoaA/NifB/PqqE/SkfB family radical SAM enzyme